MNITKSTTIVALVAASLCVAMGRPADAQPLADSSGGTSQTHGELAPTPADIVPLATLEVSANSSIGIAVPAQMNLRMNLDSTGSSSANRAAALIEDAQHESASIELVSTGRFQPYPDSTMRTAQRVARP